MPDLSIVIPAYNEAGRIRQALAAAADFFGAGSSYELIVVDDGSEDGTSAVVERWRRELEAAGRPAPVSLLAIPHQGKGAAVRAGVLAASGDLILMSDADCSTPFTEWPRLAAVIANGADLAVGSRQTPGAEIEIHQPWLRQRFGIMFGRLVRSVFPIGVIDSQCGFKAFRAAAARELFGGLKSRGFTFDVELLLRARARGFKVVEVPVHWKNHPDSRVRVWRDWPRVLRELWLIRRELPSGRERKDPG